MSKLHITGPLRGNHLVLPSHIGSNAVIIFMSWHHFGTCFLIRPHLNSLRSTPLSHSYWAIQLTQTQNSFSTCHTKTTFPTAKTLRSTSIRHRMSDRCLIGVDRRVFDIWIVFPQFETPSLCPCAIGIYQQHAYISPGTIHFKLRGDRMASASFFLDSGEINRLWAITQFDWDWN